MTTEEALTILGQQIADEMRFKSKDLGAYKTGTLYESINSSVEGDTIRISMPFYGQFVNDGHKTRLGTSNNPNYKINPLHSKAFTSPKPFIDNSIDEVLNNNLDQFYDNILNK